MVDDMKYIGRRSCDCPIELDDYLGSGKILRLAIDKYGKENFTKQILCVCNSLDELYAKEKEFINKYDAVNSYDYYNIDFGGEPKDDVRLNKRQFAKEKYMEKRIRKDKVDVTYYMRVIDEPGEKTSPQLGFAKLVVSKEAATVYYFMGYDENRRLNIKRKADRKRGDYLSASAYSLLKFPLDPKKGGCKEYVEECGYMEVPKEDYDLYFNRFEKVNEIIKSGISDVKNYFRDYKRKAKSNKNNKINNANTTDVINTTNTVNTVDTVDTMGNDIKAANTEKVEKPIHTNDSQKFGDVNEFLANNSSNKSYARLSSILDKYGSGGFGLSKQVIYYALTGHGSIQKKHLENLECDLDQCKAAINALNYALRFKDVADKMRGRRDYFYMALIYCYNHELIDNNELYRKFHGKFVNLSPAIEYANNFDDAISLMNSYYNYRRGKNNKVDIIGDFKKSKKSRD